MLREFWSDGETGFISFNSYQAIRQSLEHVMHGLLIHWCSSVSMLGKICICKNIFGDQIYNGFHDMVAKKPEDNSVQEVTRHAYHRV